MIVLGIMRREGFSAEVLTGYQVTSHQEAVMTLEMHNLTKNIQDNDTKIID